MIKAERVQSGPEEAANGISHGIGLLMAIAGIPILVWSALDRGNGFALAGALVFGIALVSLYLFSTLYHITHDRRLKQIFRALDHAAIFLLIAATYTPFLLGTLRGVWGWALFAAVWTLAVSGVVFIACGGMKYQVANICFCLALGWIAVLASRLFWLHVAPAGLILIAAGGIAYTVGTFFYAYKRIRFGHFVWHLFVLAGTICHFCAVLWYAG
ncbi:MAG: hemolysin III family protein [Chthoniobacterales bacterium]